MAIIDQVLLGIDPWPNDPRQKLGFQFVYDKFGALASTGDVSQIIVVSGNNLCDLISNLFRWTAQDAQSIVTCVVGGVNHQFVVASPTVLCGYLANPHVEAEFLGGTEIC